jgi:arginyl-tRNA synthetase
MLQEIEKFFQKKILENYQINLKEISFEKPPKESLWDFSFGCFILSKHLKKSPAIVATDLSKLLLWWKLIESINTAWPYLNIKISKDFYTDVFNSLYLGITKETYGTTIKKINLDNKYIIIDYIWANVWKPLHIGHMCTPNIGQVLINLYKKLWYHVVSDSHIWDWWIIFGKLMAAYKLHPDENKLKNDAVKYLLELYIKITSEAENDQELEQRFRDEFKLLSQWDTNAMQLWEKFTSYSIESMQLQLDRLNVKPDYNIWESFYEWIWLPKLWDYPDLEYNMKDIVSELIDKQIATKNKDNSVWVIFDEKLKIPSCILQKRDGTHWYLASDLACVKYRNINWDLDKIIYCVDVRQQLHLRQVFEIAMKAGWLNKKKESWNVELIHAHNGFISLKEWAMSTRKWKIIELDKLLNEAEIRAKKIILEKRNDINSGELKELSKIIWIGAIKYGYLKKSRETDVVFDWDEFMSFEWNSGPYIQYSYVRAMRILENYGKKLDWKSIDPDSLTNNKEFDLIKLIYNYKQVLHDTSDKNMPHILCKYIYELTKKFNSFYNNIHILNETNQNKKQARLKLIYTFAYILKDAFEILGIDMPERM